MHWLLPKVAQSFLCLLVVLLFAGCGNSYYHGSTTDHFDGRKFDNPWAPMPDSFGDFLKWRLTSDRGSWPESVPVTPSTPPVRVPGDTLRVTYVGHATVLLQTQGLNILTDPIWSERASPLSFAGPKRVAAPGVRFEDLPPIDVVLVSHNHYDHLDLPTLERLFKAFNPLVLAPLGNDANMLGAIPGLRVKVLDWGESFELNRQVRFTLEPMQHWSARSLFDRREALWGAFVVEAPGGPIYFLADAGYAADVFFRYAAFLRRQSLRVVVEKIPVTFLDITVPVTSGRRHEGDISLEKIGRSVSAVFHQRIHEKAADLDVQRIFACLQELMVVNIFFAPVFSRIVEDFSFHIQRPIV
jgi:hypothetical protein